MAQPKKRQIETSYDSLSTLPLGGWKQWLVLIAIIISGEMIFTLPFHVARYFRPTLVNVLGTGHTGLGDAFAIYGIFAFLSYFPGGMLADRFSARKLMSLSLVATALGGVYFATLPGQFGLYIVFGYWGVTTILLFWSAMIRATREWGGKAAQGRAFGILDGGRGLLGASFGALGTLLLVFLGAPDIGTNELVNPERAIHGIILYYSALTVLAALIAWIFIPDTRPNYNQPHAHPLRDLKTVIGNRTAWLQAVIVFTAYCMYRGLDYYALYITEVLGMSEVTASGLISAATYLRPVAAIGTGILADKLTTSKTLAYFFGFLIFAYGVLLLFGLESRTGVLLMITVAGTFLLTYALRAIYFALFEETNIAGYRTGITAGLVSLIGFAPDIFFNSLVGRLIDNSEAVVAFRILFIALGILSFIGMGAAVIIKPGKVQKRS